MAITLYDLLGYVDLTRSSRIKGPCTVATTHRLFQHHMPPSGAT